MSTPLQHLALVVHPDKPHETVLAHIRQWAEKNGISLSQVGEAALPGIPVCDQAWGSVDAMLVLGGDGTMLRAARLLDGAPVPVLGINLGRLGFMTTVREEHVPHALEQLSHGKFQIAERMMLAATSTGNETLPPLRALNEVVLGWGETATIATIHLRVDGELVNTFRGDGVIVSTPTGSTGHSLSAMGPIVHPGTPALLVNTICPQSLSARPVLVPDRMQLTLEVEANSKEMVLSGDGMVHGRISPGGRVDIARAEHGLHVIELEGYRYFDLLREKLNWKGFHLH